MASTPGLLPGKSHGQRSLVGYSPWGRKESDTTERLHYSPVLRYSLCLQLFCRFGDMCKEKLAAKDTISLSEISATTNTWSYLRMRKRVCRQVLPTLWLPDPALKLISQERRALQKNTSQQTGCDRDIQLLKQLAF